MLTDCSPIDSIFGSQYRWLSEGQEIVSGVTVGRFYQILNLPCVEMRDIVYFHAHTGPPWSLGLQGLGKISQNHKMADPTKEILRLASTTTNCRIKTCKRVPP